MISIVKSPFKSFKANVVLNCQVIRSVVLWIS